MRLVLVFIATLFLSSLSKAQCAITSTNGWTVNVAVQPISVVPEFTNCPNYYHYELKYKYTVTFTGSTSNRSFSANLYFTCSGGTGGNIYQHLGTFTSNTTGTLTTNNNARQYNAVSANNYGSNPNCNQVTLAHVNCTSVRIDYWGSNVNGSTINCSLSTSSLPVELISFGAFPSNNNVNVTWNTASEKNSRSFTIEKSHDGITYEEAGMVDAAGDSYQLINYNFTDKNPYKGITYYRLKQTDKDNSFRYFNPVSVDLSNDDLSVSSVYPNPTTGLLNFNINIPGDDEVLLNVYDIAGKIVCTSNRMLSAGNNTLLLDLKDMDNGIYFLKIDITNSHFSSINKFVKYQ